MTHETHSHHSPFSRGRNHKKAVYGLIGLLRGLTSDQRLNEIEAIYLQSWLLNNTYLKNDPDSIDLYDAVSDVLEDGIVSSDEREDLLQLATDIAQFRKKESGKSSFDEFQNELLAFLQGINADGVINTIEAQALLQWLDDNPQHKAEWPFAEIYPRLTQSLEDSTISEEESRELSALISSITGCEFSETGVPGGLSAWSFLEFDDTPSLDGAHICFTGTFTIGTRSTVKTSAESAGATVKTSISKKLDYLFVGSILTPDWMYTSHGRKIQEALKLKQSGHHIRLLCEDSFKAITS